MHAGLVIMSGYCEPCRVERGFSWDCGTRRAKMISVNFPGVVSCSVGFSRLPDGAAGEDEPLLHQMYKVQQPQGTLNC